MTILEMMERSGSDSTNLTISWIRDAFNMIESNGGDTTKVKKQDLVSGTRDYNLPADLMALSSVSILDTKDSNKYKRISRLVFDPLVTEDT